MVSVNTKLDINKGNFRAMRFNDAIKSRPDSIASPIARNQIAKRQIRHIDHWNISRRKNIKVMRDST